MVKEKVALLSTIALLCFVTACQKEVCEIEKEVPAKKTYPIPGGWQGKFGRGTDQPTLHFASHFKSDGKLTVEADDPIVILFGTWQLVGDSVKTEYVFPASGDRFMFAAKYVDTIPRIEGYWRGIPPTSGGGTFFLAKY